MVQSTLCNKWLVISAVDTVIPMVKDTWNILVSSGFQ